MGTIQWVWNWEDQLKEMMPMGMRVMPRSMGGRGYSGFVSIAWLGEEADFSLRYQSRKAPQEDEEDHADSWIESASFPAFLLSYAGYGMELVVRKIGLMVSIPSPRYVNPTPDSEN